MKVTCRSKRRRFNPSYGIAHRYRAIHYGQWIRVKISQSSHFSESVLLTLPRGSIENLSQAIGIVEPSLYPAAAKPRLLSSHRHQLLELEQPLFEVTISASHVKFNP